MKQPANAQASKSTQVIFPVYNEELNAYYFYDRYRAVRDRMTWNYRLELSVIDNPSTDRTSKLISDLRRQGHSVRLITHSRNFGYRASLLCGISNLEGDRLLIIAAGCESPPELIGIRQEMGGGL